MSANQALIEDEDFGEEGADVVFSGTSAKSTALSPGRYYMIATQDCHVKRGTAAGATATAASPCLYLKANVYWPLIIKQIDVGSRDAIAAIQDTAGGTLRIRRVSRKG